jgi:hypothetical protein
MYSLEYKRTVTPNNILFWFIESTFRLDCSHDSLSSAEVSVLRLRVFHTAVGYGKRHVKLIETSTEERGHDYNLVET